MPGHNGQGADLDQIQLKNAFEEFKIFLMKGMCISGKPGSTGSQNQGFLAQLTQNVHELSRKY